MLRILLAPAQLCPQIGVLNMGATSPRGVAATGGAKASLRPNWLHLLFQVLHCRLADMPIELNIAGKVTRF